MNKKLATSLAVIGALTYVGLPYAIHHLKPKPLISEQEFQRAYELQNFPFLIDYSKGGYYPNKLIAIDCNLDGKVDALIEAGVGNVNGRVLWHSKDLAGEKEGSRLMTSELLDAVNNHYLESKRISLMLLKEARKQNDKTN